MGCDTSNPIYAIGWDRPSLDMDRRKLRRFEADFRVWITLPASKGGVRKSGQAIDISEGGLGVYMAMGIEVGYVVTLEFVPPYSTQLLQLRAIVRTRCGDGFRYGLEFLFATFAQKEIVSKSCRAIALS